MQLTTITSKGQITIPQKIREALNLKSGDKIHFFTDEQGRVCFVPATKDIKLLKGIVAKPKKPISVEEMNATIKRRASHK